MNPHGQRLFDEAFDEAFDGVFDVAVVGAGVAGLSLTRAAARAGFRTLLLERADSAPGDALACGGASALPAALLNPWRGRKGAAHPDDLRGLAVVWRWAEEFAFEGRDPGAHRSGLLRLPTSARQAREWRARARSESALAWSPAGTVPPPYRAPFGALRVEDGGWLEPDRWRAALAASARDHGATLRWDTPVGRLVRGHHASDPGAWTLATHEGTPLASARTVVVAVGADAPPAASQAGRDVAWPTWERTRGEVVTLRGGPPFARPIAGSVYGAARDDLAWVGGGHRPADVHDPGAPEHLRSAFAYALPAYAQVPIADVWSGVRAKRKDARPSVDEVAAGVWTFGAFAGRGFLCAADEAERWVACLAGAPSDGTGSDRTA